ncbi:hypothetical protein BOO69_09540 [Sulfitobacter alexandrii]|uniref:Uncharacterized protein n=1 Tax=Sulfitobacter alexandrii TaxID=1917485 RepID=A0A1J0WH24_9RHOB|nr:hypothetical protein [Sulfitobacter alexandrii]APE43629.1 hypothetical protein BOO69_09540 [Sulfitobacter alexandrii]
MSKHYASIVKLAKARVRPVQIAQQLGIHPNGVYEAIRKARAHGEKIETFARTRETSNSTDAVSPVTPRNILIPMRLHSLLEQGAAEHGMTTSEYGQRLLEKALLGTVVRHD